MHSERAHTCFDLGAVAALTHCRLVGDPLHLIAGVADLEEATSEEASFFSNPRYREAMVRSRAGVIFVDGEAALVEGKNYLLSSDPSSAFQKLVEAFYPPKESSSGFEGIHPTAVIHESALLEEGISVGPHAVIDERVRIGAGTKVGSGAYIGPDTTIGVSCLIHPRVVIREGCSIGNRVIIQPGAVIGSCGFGYITDEQGRHTKLHQVGGVVIEDDVEIGANTAIDRARFRQTRIGRGTKIDNLVQIGHGVRLGPDNLIIAQSGIAGSTSTGRCVVLAGHVAVAGHLQLEDGVRVAGKSGVTKSLTKGKYGGIPAVPLEKYNRSQVFLRHIEQYVEQIKGLAKRLETLEHLLAEHLRL